MNSQRGNAPELRFTWSWENNTLLTAGTASRRGTRLSCVPSMLGSWEVKVFYPT